MWCTNIVWGPVMASINEHSQDCINQLGEPFREVHVWLDEFFATKGYRHRIMRHHTEGVEEARRKWGDRAATAAQIHIMKDCNGKVPTREEAILWSIL